MWQNSVLTRFEKIIIAHGEREEEGIEGKAREKGKKARIKRQADTANQKIKLGLNLEKT